MLVLHAPAASRSHADAEKFIIKLNLGHLEILYCSCFLSVLEDVSGSVKHRGVGPGVSDDGSHICLDDRNCDFFCRHDKQPVCPGDRLTAIKNKSKRVRVCNCG